MAVTCLDVCIICICSCDYDEFFVILYNVLQIDVLECYEIKSSNKIIHVKALCLSVDSPYGTRLLKVYV
jgi:hypothetical protein